MRVEQARRLKELEKENTRLKRLAADLSLDNALQLFQILRADDSGILRPTVAGMILFGKSPDIFLPFKPLLDLGTSFMCLISFLPLRPQSSPHFVGGQKRKLLGCQH